MQTEDIYKQIAASQGISLPSVKATLQLLADDCTIPFIARYRKEKTGAMDEVQIAAIQLQWQQWEALEKRKLAILKAIESQDKLTPELQQRIEQCTDETLLEDIYLPYKVKRKTRATVAREKGLEPLALWLMRELPESCRAQAGKFLRNGIENVEEALQGARDIVAELMSEHAEARNRVRDQYRRYATVGSKVVKAKKAEAQKYRDYFNFEESLNRCPSHRLLAILRGEEEGLLRVTVMPDEELTQNRLLPLFIRRRTESSAQLELALKDAYKRLLAPSIENETRAWARVKAEDEAIQVFAENLRQLLLAPPLGSKSILAIDPGFRSGCKCVSLNAAGDLLAEEVIYPHEPQRHSAAAANTLCAMLQKHPPQAIAIGNGTAGRETEQWVKSLPCTGNIPVFLVNESGASVYSASAIAREEFPNHDLTLRGAVSIGRRLADPLAELVKIDPKAIGVGQYQHDVDQQKLKLSLDTVVQHCVNKVGVNLNTASKSLLMYVSGLNESTAQNIVLYRQQNGAFRSRQELKKVSRLGAKSFEQSAGFLRIPEAENPLDNSAVHPESYALVSQIAKAVNSSVGNLIGKEQVLATIQPQQFVGNNAGLQTIQDILKELAKPGRDPREALTVFSFADVRKPEDLYEGMVLPGIVTNITRFGCFVDVGVKQDGMVHISQLANKYVSDPNTVVKLGQQVLVKVLELDLARKRIALSIKQAT